MSRRALPWPTRLFAPEPRALPLGSSELLISLREGPLFGVAILETLLDRIEGQP